MAYTFELFDHADLSELREVYFKSFGSGGDSAYFQWKYLDNPGGKAVAFVARHEGSIVGFYGVIPEHYIINGRKEIIHQSMDTMTHPDHRGKGLFVNLAKATFAHLQRQGMGLHVIGYPGPTSYPGFVNKLGWKCIAEFKYLFAYKWSFGITSLLRSRPSVEVAHILSFDHEWDRYFKQHEPPTRPIEKHIDRAFLHWRLERHPSIPYAYAAIRESGELVGYCVYRIDKGRVFILNMDFKHTGNYATHTHAVIRYLFDLPGVTAVHTFVASIPALENAYRALGFVTNPFKKGPFSYRTPFIVLAEPRSDGVQVNDIASYAIQPITRDY